MKVIEKLKIKIESDTGVEVLNISQIKRGKLSKSNRWAFVVITKDMQNIGSMCTMSELCNKKDKIEIISNGVSFDEFV